MEHLLRSSIILMKINSMYYLKMSKALVITIFQYLKYYYRLLQFHYYFWSSVFSINFFISNVHLSRVESTKIFFMIKHIIFKECTVYENVLCTLKIYHCHRKCYKFIDFVFHCCWKFFHKSKEKSWKIIIRCWHKRKLTMKTGRAH